MSRFLLIIFAGLLTLPIIASSPVVLYRRLEDGPYFHFSSIGDSWAAGPSIDSQDAYGGPDQASECALHKASWEALMARDDSWTVNPIQFNFAACSGAVLQDATEGAKSQIPRIGTPQLLTIQLGGNDAHFGDISTDCIYQGDFPFSQRDYPQPDGACFKTILKWETYLGADKDVGDQGSFYADHQSMLTRVLDDIASHGRGDPYLYIVSYAEFFNTSPGSDWCNDKSFGLFWDIKLSNVLRSKLNELVRKLNAVTAQSVSDMKNDRIRYLDPSSLFDNHRFCEPHHTLNNQYFLNDVWFWNISPHEQDPDYLAADVSVGMQSAWAEEHKFFNGTTATVEQLLTLLHGPITPNSKTPSSRRTLHPKDLGHIAIKDGMIDRLRKDNVPGVRQAPKPEPPPERRPYEMGPIHIHINEYWDCLDSADNLSVGITMSDSTGAQIGYMKRTQAGASAAARMKSRLEETLIISPQWAKGGYIQFQLGDFLFNTNTDRDNKKPTHCIWGGFDPREGPKCWVQYDPELPAVYQPDAYSLNQVDCWFPAPDWKGGKSSDS